MKSALKKKKISEREELISNFKEEWYSQFSISFLTEKGKKELKDLVLSDKYAKLSSRKIAAALHVGRGSIDALRRKQMMGDIPEEEKKEKKKGRPRKNPINVAEEIITPKLIVEEIERPPQDLELK